MIVFRTRDDWSTVSIDVTDGITPSTWNCSSSVRDAKAALEDLAAHMGSTYGDAGVVTWADSAAGIASGFVTTSGTYDYTPDTEAQALLGVSAGSADVLEALAPSGVVACYRTVAEQPTVAVSPGVPDFRATARPAASVGAVAMASPGTAATLYRCAAYLREFALPAMRAALQVARNPRTAQVYDGASWTVQAVGPISFRVVTGIAHVAEWEGLV